MNENNEIQSRAKVCYMFKRLSVSDLVDADADGFNSDDRVDGVLTSGRTIGVLFDGTTGVFWAHAPGVLLAPAKGVLDLINFGVASDRVNPGVAFFNNV
jgi:hypothetical protein